MTPRQVLAAGLLLAVAAATAAGQTFPFQLVVTQGQNSVTVQNGATVTVVAPVGQTQTARLQAIYSGTGQVSITQQPTITGSTAFHATITDAFPISLGPGGRVSITISFSPTSASSNSAQLSLPFVENLSSGASNPNSINLALEGAASAFALSYVLQTDQNVVSLQPGGQIPFPATLIGTTAQAALNLTNTGSGSGTVTGITITGSAFHLQGLPLLPATVAAGGNLQVSVLYKPTAVSTDTGQINITFGTGSPVTVNLQGSGSAPGFTYQILNTTPPTVVSPGGVISLPDVKVGQTSSVTVRVLNAGNASGSVSSISLAGQDFVLGNLPALPQTLAPDGSVTFTINFTPSQPGALSATLFVNSDTFKLAGTGLGPLLTFSYDAAGTTITLGGTNNSVVFSPVIISQSAQLSFDVKNTGTLAATISNIGVGQITGPYSLSGLPPLPVTLAPNSDFRITIKFTPVALGFSNGTLLLDTTTIALVGSGTQPPPLPSYTIAGPSGNAAPMTQPTVGLTLASPYPVAISGTLTMTVAGTLPVDPAVQFATGGRTVPFVIPANQTAAQFGAQGSLIGLQTGTVDANITVTPSFATQAGSVDLTPAVPDSLQFAVAPATPKLVAVQLTNLSATGFTVQVTGFSTTRSLTSWALQLTAASGYSLATSQFNIDVKQISTVWFQSTASQTFGGQFSMTIPFTFQGVSSNQSVLNAIASVSVTMSNELGASNSIQAALP